MRKNLTEIVFILDRSGSMSGLEADTIGGFNSMIAKQKRAEGEAVISTVLFNDNSEVIHDRVNIGEIRPMTEEEQKDYPNCTFMFDCVLPDDGDEILVSNGRFVWMDVFCNDIDELFGNVNFLDELLAFDLGGDLRLCLGGSNGVGSGNFGGNGNAGTHLAVHLHGDLHHIVLALGFVVLRPGLLCHHAFAQGALLPHFFGHMGCKGIEQDGEHGQLVLGDGTGVVDLVDESHKSGDGRVELQVLDVLVHLLDGLVEAGFQRLAGCY